MERELFRRLALQGLELDSKMNDQQRSERLAPWFDARIAPLLRPLRPEVPPLTFTVVANETIGDHLKDAYGDAVRSFGEAMQRDYAGWIAFYDEVWFERAEFSLSYKAPGRLLETNGQIEGDQTVRWRFDLSDFALRPEELTVQSVLVDERRLRKYEKAALSARSLAELAAALGDIPPADIERLKTVVLRGDRAALTESACSLGRSVARSLGPVLGVELRCEADERPTKTAPGSTW
jgi:hypothetical protein